MSLPFSPPKVKLLGGRRGHGNDMGEGGGDEATLSKSGCLMMQGSCLECHAVREWGISLVPRPHPLTRRNSMVNQVEFLGLAGTLVTV